MSPLKSYRYLVSQNKLISPDPIKYFHHRIYTTDFATPIILKEKYYVKAFGVVGVILRLKCFAGSGSMQAIFKWKTLHKCYLPLPIPFKAPYAQLIRPYTNIGYKIQPNTPTRAYRVGHKIV